MSLPWLMPEHIEFPAPDQALAEPDGLLAAGGDLSVPWLLCAYRQGIFPWYEADQPILWWSPDPRLVLLPDRLNISRSLRKFIRKCGYLVTMDTNFSEVIKHCARSRRGEAGTWLTEDMQLAYTEFHNQGYAHSVEVWDDSRLVGGLYGVALGKVFFGESMFSLEDNASKLALVYLVAQLQDWGFELIDCQVSSEHLLSLGAEEMTRKKFQQTLAALVDNSHRSGPWQMDQDLIDRVKQG